MQFLCFTIKDSFMTPNDKTEIELLTLLVPILDEEEKLT